jgi:hypothetical protein
MVIGRTVSFLKKFIFVSIIQKIVFKKLEVLCPCQMDVNMEQMVPYVNLAIMREAFGVKNLDNPMISNVNLVKLLNFRIM